ncbi:MAG: HAMP domain-containing sensor histidine kinase, partial [Candidatus Cloacimonetes bacterium]|nr:HAMP domain-containing sensor histidine kinase [Candidatus Cloacimonadota bacterium]
RRFYYANVGDFQNAYQILARTSELKDSTFTQETRKTIASLESNFQLEKKNIEIEVLKKDNQIKNMEIKRERMLTTVLLLGLIILSISLYLIISLKRKRDKLYKTLEQNMVELEKKDFELDQANKSKDKFFSIIAHDLKNPLGTLTTLTKMLKEEFPHKEKEDLYQLVDLSVIASDNLYKLLENLLTWARTQLGHLKPELTEIDLSSLVDEVLNTMFSQANQKGIVLGNLTEPGLIITSDQNSLKTIIRNLINNGVKYSDSGGKIEISAYKTDSEITIRVRDYGVGMDEDTRNRLFKIDEVSSRKGTQKESGTGLGLILCYELVKLLGGKIRVESEPDKGSVFILQLPV